MSVKSFAGWPATIATDVDRLVGDELQERVSLLRRVAFASGSGALNISR
jgi:hypothetical protein